MKLPNFLIHTFAAVGVISLIFWGCAAADSDNIDNPLQLTEGYGKYQVSYINFENMVILNTENGILKSYHRDNNLGAVWFEISAPLTVNH